jgi:hypothetical protein
MGLLWFNAARQGIQLRSVSFTSCGLYTKQNMNSIKLKQCFVYLKCQICNAEQATAGATCCSGRAPEQLHPKFIFERLDVPWLYEMTHHSEPSGHATPVEREPTRSGYRFMPQQHWTASGADP